jgi:PKD repeat protein
MILIVKKSDAQCNFYQLTNTSNSIPRTFTYYECGATTTSTISVPGSSSSYICAKQVVTSGYTQINASGFTYSPTTISCGGTVTLTGQSSPTVAANYFSISGNGGTVYGSKTLTVSNYNIAKSGTYTLTLGPYGGSYGGCSSAVQSITLPLPLPSSLITVTSSSNGPVCEGNILSLSSNVTGTSSSSTYSWTGPNGFTSTEQNPTVSTNATAAMSGTYTVTVISNSCSASPSSVNVQINKSTASSNGPVCQGATLSLSASTIAGASYYWTGPNGFTSTQQNPTHIYLLSGVYNVSVTITGPCISTTINKVVNIPPGGITVSVYTN